MKMEYSQTIINKRKVKQMCLHFVIWKGQMSFRCWKIEGFKKGKRVFASSVLSDIIKCC
jgi:hypothetical protein